MLNRVMSWPSTAALRLIFTAAFVLALALTGCTVLAAAPGQAAAAGFRKVTLATSLVDPIDLAVAHDGRVFVAERTGRVLVYTPGDHETRVIGKLSVITTGELGLLGLALDPEFPDNGWVYLAYARSVGSGIEVHVSRFTLSGGALRAGSERLLLKVPMQDDIHAAGQLAFGPDGNLYFSTGDDVDDHDPHSSSEGYTPIDERPGHAAWDAQRSSGSTMDLRGKILRITPLRAGGYSIPPGNLFPNGGGRPEIYAMGLRNPFRFSIDSKTGWLYIGDVGPNAREASPTRGPLGYDEINVAREPGNYGWPYCIGDNKPYVDYDFETELSSGPFDCNAPTNDSPNNSGSQTLPPAKPALLWYPYVASPEFPELGTGGRTALAGPVYRWPRGGASARAFPKRFAGSLFIYEWMRSWVKTVRLQERGRPPTIRPFGSQWGFRRPIDMEFGTDGALYVLEWGTEFWGPNDDAGLYRIAYNRTARCGAKNVTIIGSRGRDQLRGTPGRDVIASYGGTDRIRAGRGNDLVCAGAGKDVVRGGAGRDKLRGRGGMDRLLGGSGSDKLFGGDGRDVCKGGRGDDSAFACETE